MNSEELKSKKCPHCVWGWLELEKDEQGDEVFFCDECSYIEFKIGYYEQK